MKNIDLKAPAILLIVCFGIGAVIDYFTKIHWLPAGLIVLAALLVNGMAISIEDRNPGGLDYDKDEKPESKRELKKMVRIQAISTVVVSILAIAAYVYTNS